MTSGSVTTRRQTSSRQRTPLDAVTFVPRTRSFVVGSTGSGKSTLAAALLESYSRRYPRHLLYIVDPKRRFVPVDLEPSEGFALFPDGFKERNHGRRDGVAVTAEPIDKPRGPRDGERAFLIQEDAGIYDTFAWLYRHSDVRRPALVYCDESFDFMRGVRADPSMRRLMQQGRELGIGVVVINQRPKWIDATFLSEATRLYVGRLTRKDDREYIADSVNEEEYAEQLERPIPKFSFVMIDQERETHMRFRLAGLE